MRRNYSVYILLTLYLILFFTTLDFNYVEGDDAATILFHLFNRNINIQAPYSAYHSGFDFLLSFLPAHEPTLRIFAITVSFIFGFLSILSLRLFLKELFEKHIHKIELFIIIVPFIIPDILFHSLLYNPTNISGTFYLLSLTYFLRYLKTEHLKYSIITIITFAVAVSFRWSFLMGLPVFVGFYIFTLFQIKQKDKWHKHVNIFFIGWLALIMSLVCIYLTGYSLNDLMETMLWGRQYIDNSEKSVLATFATSVAFFTPAFITLIFVAFVVFMKKIKNNFQHLVLLLISFMPFFYLGFLPSFKYMYTVFPIIVFFIFKGFVLIMNQKIIRIIFLLALFFPWFIGLRVFDKNLVYGPGFHYKFVKSGASILINEKNLDQRVKVSNISPVLGAGILMPTLEGPRPFYGYFSVLFLSEWKKEIRKFNDELEVVVELLGQPQNVVRIFQDRQTAFLQCVLFRRGFSCNSNFYESENIKNRLFFKENKQIVLEVANSKNDKIGAFLNEIRNYNGTVIYRSSYSSLITSLRGRDTAFQSIGPFTAIRYSKI